MVKKLNIAVIFGGTNTEHEVSLVSARSIIHALNPNKYNILPVMVTKDNRWVIPKDFLIDSTSVKYLPQLTKTGLTVSPQQINELHPIDVYFPIIHGPFGEDGTLQGLLELMHVPYVGSGVLSSALCMDKDVQKRLSREAGIPVVPYQCLNFPEKPKDVPYPCFVKPANQGSSVGVIKVHATNDLENAVKQAYLLDNKIIIEQAVNNPREIECAVLGETNHPQASFLGEVIPSNEFYDYDAKYVDGKSTSIIPAKLSHSLTTKIRKAALKAFTVCGCYGLARVDFLVPRNRVGEYYLSELNTLPGFTTISMYPKLWEASGLSYSKLVDTLIDLAIKRYHNRSKLNLTYTPKTDWYQS